MNSLQKLVCFLTETTEMEKKAWQTSYIVLVIFALIPWIVLTIYFITLKYHVKYYVNNELVNVAKYKKNTGSEKLKKYDYTSYEDDVPYYTMIIQEDGRKIKLLLDLTEEMLHTMKTQFPERVYFA